MLWRQSLRNLIRKKARSLLTLLALVIGVSALFAVISTVETAKTVTDERLRLVLGNADYSLFSVDQKVPETTLELVRDERDVLEAIGVMHRQSAFQLPNTTAATNRLRLTGLSTVDNKMLQLDIISGSLNADGIIIPSTTSVLLGATAGDSMTISLPSGTREVPVAAVVADTPLLEGPVHLEDAKNKQWRALTTTERLQEWYAEPGQLDEIRMAFRDGVPKQQMVDQLQTVIADESLYFQEVVLDEKQTNQLDDLFFMLYVIGGLAMLISAFILYNTLYVSISERNMDIAVMRTIGYTPRQIVGVFLTEVVLLAGLGLVVGIPAGFLLAGALQEGLFSSFQANLTYTTQFALALPITIVLGLLIPVIASLLPIISGSKVDIIRTLKSIPTEPKDRSHKRFIAGIIFLAGTLIPSPVAILFLWVAFFLLSPYFMRGISTLFVRGKVLGYEGFIAASNIKRSLHRATNMSFILSLAICTGLLVSSLFSALEKQIAQDIQRSFGGDLHYETTNALSKDEMQALATLDGVATISAYPERQVTWLAGDEYRQLTVISTDTKWYEQHPLFFSKKELLPEMESSGGVVLGEAAFREWGGRVGEEWTAVVNGDRVTFTVLAQVVTSQYAGYTAFLSEGAFSETFGAIQPVKGLITTVPDVRQGDVKAAMLAAFPFEMTSVQTRDEAIDKQTRALPGVQSLFDGLLLIAIVITGIGILNALTMSVLERKREIGIMRAVAFTPFQTIKTVQAEGLLIGINGVVVGILLGISSILLTVQISDDSLITFTVPISTLVIAVVSGLLISAVAAFVPSYHATKENMIKSLKQE